MFSVPQELLDQCADEPIHRTGAIQAFGALLTLDEQGIIIACSANTETYLGLAPDRVLGRRWTELFQPASAQVMEAALRERHAGELVVGPVLVNSDRYLEMLALLHPQTRIIELIPEQFLNSKTVTVPRRVTLLNNWINELTDWLISHDQPIEAFCQLITEKFRILTQYDRVMVYRFDPEYNGEVIAEAKREELPTYLGLHYPASDIPPQARKLYLECQVRVLADVNSDPVPILCLPQAGSPTELDIGLCYLRSMSPVHREYLSNMGVRATLVASIIKDGRLWGLISCHHLQPKIPQLEWLDLTRGLSKWIGTQLALMENRLRTAAVLRMQQAIRQLNESIHPSPILRERFGIPEFGFREMLSSSGFAVVHRGEIVPHGRVPAKEQILRLVAWLENNASESLFYTDRLGALEPAFREIADCASGICAIRLQHVLLDWLIWFRPEEPQEVTWAGNPEKGIVIENGTPRLRPRKSFESWVELRRGRSRPWSETDLAVVAEVLRPNLYSVLNRLAYLEASERLRLLDAGIHNANDAIIITKSDVDPPESRIIFANPAFLQITGYTLEEVLGRSLQFLEGPKTDRAILQRIQECLLRQETAREELILYTKTGQPYWVDLSTTPLCNLQGKVTHFLYIQHDITQRKLAELALARSERFLNETGEMARVGGWEVELPSRKISWTLQTYAIYEFPVDKEPLYEEAISFYHPEDQPRLRQLLDTAIRHGIPFEDEFRFCTLQGKPLWVRVQCHPEIEGGRVVRLRGTFQDITRRKETELALLDREERQQAILRASPDAMLLFDGQHRLVDLHYPDAMRSILPMAKTEQTPLQIFPPEPGEKIVASQQRVLATGEPEILEFSLVGQQQPCWLEARIVRCGKDRTLVIIRDVTQRTLTEQKLRHTLERYEWLDQHMEDAITVHDPTGRYLYASSSTAWMWGYRPEELFNTDPYQLIHPDDLGKVRHSHMEVLAGKTIRVEWRVRKSDGSYLWLETFAKPIVDSQGQVCQIICASRDITQRKQLEEQIRQSQKLEAIGQLAGGIAHDFNNILTVISGYAEVLRRDGLVAEPHRELIEEISKASERGTALTRQLLAFSRKQILQPEILDINATLKELVRMLRRLLGEAVSLQLELNEEAWPIHVDRGQFTQILLNLSINARDAMPQGGLLTIATANVTIPDGPTLANLDLPHGEYVELSVRDTGIGMTPEVRARLFEPFFTTKEVGKGTGLGLATVYGIVRQSGGAIQVQSQPNQGTLFRLYFPRAQSSATAAPTSATLPPPISPQRPKRILIVEDDDSVRMLTSLILRREGSEVVEAVNAEHAIELVPQHPTFDLLITDVVMPGMGGRELAERLTQQFPLLRVIYLSGYTSDEVLRHGIEQDRVWFLQKPYKIETLMQMIAEIFRSQ